MFGNAWTNPQQNQQQQQPGTSAFGQQQPNAFGSGGTGAFGGGAFGQQSQQQPQQPAVNPMFGGTTNTTNTSGTSGFGTFGGGGTSAFAPKPSGFGAFGGGNTGTSAFGSGSTGAFGQTNNAGTSGTTAFGQPAGGTSSFGGTGNSLFGQKTAAPTGAFGSTSTGPVQGTADVNAAPVTTGSSNPPYNAFTEKDGTATLHYQSITMMPAYRGSSFEEIRVQDYAQGRKTAGAFGQSASFGMAPSQSTTSAFGQPPAASTSAFGGFGQTNQQPAAQQPSTFGSFGQPAASQPSAFGAGAGTTTFGGFGQNNQQQQQQPAAPGVFGSGGGFGQNTQQQQQQQPQAGTSAFGTFGQNNTQPKPFGTFGTGTGTGAFGGGAFGQPNNQPAGQTGTTGNIFGQPANQAQPTTNAFSAFGANNNAQKSAFGQPAAQPATTGFGLFGQQNNQQQQQQPNQQGQQPSTGLFGNPGASTGTNLFGQQNNQQQGQQNPSQPSTGLFGQQPAQPAPTGLFGNPSGGTGIFGNNNNQPKPGGGFGNNMFGANNQANAGTNQPSTGMFGQPLGQSTAQAAPGSNAFGASLFGQKPANNNTFGQSTAQPASTGFGTNSLFGNSTLGGPGGGFGQSTAGAGGQQGGGTLTASVAQPVQDNLPIFTLLHGPSRAASIAYLPKKPTNFFSDIPSRTPLAISQSRFAPGTVPGRLRGFGISLSSAGLNRSSKFAASLAASKNTPNNLALSRADGRSLLGPDAFLSNSSSLGSGGMSSPKKLILDRKIDPQEIFGRSIARNAASTKTKVSFNPAMSIAARDREAQAQAPKPAAPTSPNATSPGRKSTPLVRDPSDLEDGDYYCKPPLDVLRRMSNSELAHFDGLVVGRKNYGEIQFLEPVDLTTLPKLKDLLGKLIQIHKKKTNEVIVYPDTPDDEEKPRPGEGINVPARIILTGCWPKDKATGTVLKDDKAPIFQKHLKKLKSIKHTHFESYDVKEGRWQFTVDHF